MALLVNNETAALVQKEKLKWRNTRIDTAVVILQL